jgi:hypothetical protein
VAVEFAIISVLVVLGSFGAIEVGRVLQIRNEMSSLSDRVARDILMQMQAFNRDTTLTKLRARFKAPRPDLLDLQTSFDAGTTAEGDEFRTIVLTYPITLMVPGISQGPITLTVQRRTPDPS